MVDGTVTFDVTGTAKQLQPVDAAALLPQVLGLTEPEAHAVLDPYGRTVIHLWPGFVATIPTLERRVNLVVTDPVDTTPAASPTPAPTQTPTAEPSAVESPGRRESGGAGTIRLMPQPRLPAAGGTPRPRAARPASNPSVPSHHGPVPW